LTTLDSSVNIYPLDLTLSNTDMIPEVSMNVSIIKILMDWRI